MEKEKDLFPPVTFDEFPLPSFEEWKEEAVKLLKGGEFDKRLLTKTFEGITLQPIYTQADVEKSSELPGVSSYKRGTKAEGYTEKVWDSAQEILADTPGQANEIMKEELAGGTNSFYFKMSPESLGVNAPSEGVHAFTHDEFRATMEGISFKNIGAYMNTGYSSYPYVNLISEAKGCFVGAHGHVGGDPLGTFAKVGVLPRPLGKLYDEMAEAVKFVEENAAGVRTVVIDSSVYAGGGADSVNEMACVFATVSEYMAAMTERGISADLAAKSIGITLTLGSDHFMEMAKIRAAKVLFAQITSAFGASEEAQKISIHAVTSSFNKTLFDPYVNVLRISTEVFSGIAAGVDALTVLPFDSVAGKSDAHARRISRNISTMMAEEFSLKSPVDPAGGSWYVETLTNQFIDAVWTKFTEYENAGGFYKALCDGIVQQAIEKVLNDKKSRLNTRALRAVGTNMYANVGEKLLEREPKANSVKVNKPAKYEGGLDAERLKVGFGEGLSVLSIYEAINTGSDAKCTPIRQARLTEDFEAMRLKTEEMGGINLLLLNMGPVSQHKARADFSTGFFEVGGFKVSGSKMCDSADEAVNEAINAAPHVCVICSTDDTYPELVPAIAKGIKAKNKNIQVVVAGAPAPEYKDAYLEAGVDEFIHIRSNCLETLEKIQAGRGNN